jgi:glycerol kinase
VQHLVIDVGTSNIRVAMVSADATITTEIRQPFLPSTPYPGAVEFDAEMLAAHVLRMCAEILDRVGPAASIGITNQRASSIVWDRATGVPVAPALGWQDLRTAGTCMMVNAQGFNIAPNASATKVSFLLDMVDASRSRDLCFGTVDSWLVWTLTNGREHVIESSNAAVTKLVEVTDEGGLFWDPKILAALNIPITCLPRIIDSTGLLAQATALPGAPLIGGIAGDQQSSLLGQGCVRPGDAKITFGTGGMFDVIVGPQRPAMIERSVEGTFPIVAWQQQGAPMWGTEAIMLSAGTCIEWLREDMGLIATAADSEIIAAQCESTNDVWFVPALLGLGTPLWDYGARGTFVGLTRGTGRPEMVRAVLEGIAHRGADLVDAARIDTGLVLQSLRVDGGMSANGLFLQALADATQLRVEVSPVAEATTIGAGFLAGLATGTWSAFDDLSSLWRPSRIIEPRPQATQSRDRWRAARDHSRYWIEGMSALTF